ncbi:MAG: GAF domain-containing protein [Cyanobacteria bacterium RM1_2_2]|nr:GAF domain-containing protein [Cyanobacteria bacterium RM1_2_2]
MIESQLLGQEQLLRRITNHIRQSLELDQILTTAVAEVRSFLSTDRVKIYRFFEDGHGQVIAESIHDHRLPSLLGLHFPADDIPTQARELFRVARQRSIVDLANQRIGENSPEESEDIRYRPVDPCHVEYLRTMGVRSSVVVPILQQETLWGLLVSHHAEPRQISEADLQVLQSVVDQLEIAIMQATLVSQIQAQSAQEAAVNQISTLLHSVPAIQLDVALQATVDRFAGAGGRLYLLPNGSSAEVLYTCGEQPALLLDGQPLEHHYLWQNYLQTLDVAQAGNPSNPADSLSWIISDLYKYPAFRTLAPCFQSTTIRGLMMVPLWYGQRVLGCLTLFRNQIETKTLWAGEHDPDHRQLLPRQSFSAWCELKSGQIQEWTDAEVKLAQTIGAHFAMAAQQYHLYDAVNLLNASLEQQVQERTAKIQQAVEQQKALASVVAKIRASLDLNFTFQATVQEVRQLLEADRVGIFYFAPDSNWSQGEFIAEDVHPAFTSVLGIKVDDHCFSEKYAMEYHRGRIQAVADIYTAGLKDCHVEALSRLQIRANLIAPLSERDQLQGLLCIHQGSPREWTSSEIDFVTQIASQLCVGIQQAKLLSQTQQQAEQLSQALQTVQNTQSQLVQTEKMSSLGQLVAGIAHEINNPVNFIYGNLDHARAYTEDLLQVIQTYQKHYPEPVPSIQSVLESTDLNFVIADFPKILASMKMGSDRIRQIVQSLRTFSRLDQAERKPVDLHEGIESTLLILQHRLKLNGVLPGIQIVKEYGSLPLVECYAGQLNQVFMNILSNAIDALEARDLARSAEAIKASPSIIKIQTGLVCSQENQQQAVICIADNGNGMSEAVKSRIFDPFYTTKPVGKGTGLGLSISYQVITEKHNGTLECISQPGEGTEFWITLPLG